MKKKVFKFLAVSAAALAAGISLVGCGESNPTTTKEITPTTTETTTVTTTETTTEDPTPTTTTFVPKDNYDDITKTLTLTKSYSDTSSFLTDGIEEVTLQTATDGDTANFKCKHSGESVTIRFYSVDTPESTGGVEKWGKSASLYTKKKLESAYALLLEGSQTPPVVDSYGSRYLAYIWYKETADSAWKNLNLEIVENGYSKSKALVEDAYFDYFENAQTFARRVPLHIWSNDEDPYFSEDSEYVSVKDLHDNFDNYYDAEEGVGKKVCFDGYVSNVQISGSGTYTWKVTDYDSDGNQYTINVYTGYTSSNATKYIKVGSLYTFTGTVQKYSGQYQVSGITYVPMQTGGDYLTRKEKNYYIQFNSNLEYKDYFEKKTLYKDATVTAAVVEGNTLTITATAVNTYDFNKNADDAETVTFTFYTTVEDGFNATSLVGKKFSTTGIQEEDGSQVIHVLRYSNFNFK
ncbi:endonuclease YncB(thermonuclease family) [Anaeroplasma bactoclasticum]|uniref:Endonuclease YncB(Thermonuclease family) n=1 Tax=Anaeroplasma bactoclasticum TaxID=2088 RepID=A0A397RPG1_9MOLU|nr:thermonuclease family protein [Anaeroplasma bactoclasticum]RIA75568.1 endonuclease YncB(thermonuclease family) [Anaeroplasma bactoclasticum]